MLLLPTKYIKDLFWMFYPTLCASCNRPLYEGEKCICTPCRFGLPKTGFHLEKINPVVKHFWGKVPVENATAFFHFGKGQKVQRLIHQLKYKGRQDVGEFIGGMMGHELKKSELYADVSVIVPVPLHPTKLRKRGYNQSDCIASGIAHAMRVRFSPDALMRTSSTETQTRKHRFERFKNVENVFALNRVNEVGHQHVLLVDDVITTGSTLISCASLLTGLPETRVSIAAIAGA